LNVILLSVIVLSVLMLSIIILGVVMLSVFMLSAAGIARRLSYKKIYPVVSWAANFKPTATSIESIYMIGPWFTSKDGGFLERPIK
jgi:hypothetical protein